MKKLIPALLLASLCGLPAHGTPPLGTPGTRTPDNATWRAADPDEWSMGSFGAFPEETINGWLDVFRNGLWKGLAPRLIPGSQQRMHMQLGDPDITVEYRKDLDESRMFASVYVTGTSWNNTPVTHLVRIEYTTKGRATIGTKWSHRSTDVLSTDLRTLDDIFLAMDVKDRPRPKPKAKPAPVH